MKKRVREISDREKYENLIDAYVQSGYKITRDDWDYCKLRKSNYGGWGWNIIIFVLTVWWTFFLGEYLINVLDDGSDIIRIKEFVEG